MKQKFFYLFVVIFTFSFLLFHFTTRWFVHAQEADHLVISEIQIAGATADDEFTEIYNPTPNPIDLQVLPLKFHIRTSTGTDYNRALTFIRTTIPAYGFFLIGPSTGYTGTTSLDATYSVSGSKLVANGGVYISKSSTAEGEVMDKVGWGSQPSPGFETAAFSDSPPQSQSLERKPGGGQGNVQDTGSNANDFFLQINPNPQNFLSQSIQPAAPPLLEPSLPPSEPPSELPPEESPASESSPPESLAEEESSPPQEPSASQESPTSQESQSLPPSPGSVVINEFVSDPEEEGQEWVELFNKTPEPQNLTDWWIEEGSKSKTELLGEIAPGGFLVVKKPKGNLNNSGDTIVLKDFEGRLIDEVSYGKWDDGEVADNALSPRDGAAAVRFPDGGDSDIDFDDWAITFLPTPLQPNQVSEKIEEIAAFSDQIIINELFSNPKGDDRENEFIELKNIGSETVDLQGWEVGFKGGGRFIIERKKLESTEISGGGTLLIPRTLSKIILLNSGGEVRLFDPNDTLVDSLSYGEALEGLALSRDQNLELVWTTEPTPGKENIIILPSHPPKAEIEISKEYEDEEAFYMGEQITFDASDSYDPDGDDLSFLWGIDKVTADQESFTYIFEKPGTYQIVLTVKDTKGLEDSKKISLKINEIVEESEEIGQSLQKSRPTPIPGSVVVNEFMADPSEDEEEWIELYNKTGIPQDLSDWWIEDGSGKKTELSETIGPGGFWLIEKPSGKLNNTGDIIILKDFLGQIIDQVAYGVWNDGNATDNAPSPRDGAAAIRFPDGQDSNLDVNDFKITSLKTPGSPNLLAKEKEEIAAISYSSSVILNEILPNPKGDDRENEFIELKNIGSETVDLQGWEIKNSRGKTFTISSKAFPSTRIEPGKIFVIFRKTSKIALLNSGDRLSLHHPNDYLVTSLTYEEKVEEGQALALDQARHFVWTTFPTPGSENIILKPNLPPQAETEIKKEGEDIFVGERITFDASDSYDPDNDPLQFRWKIEDKTFTTVSVNHVFEKKGTYKILLEVEDGRGGYDKKKISLKVLQKKEEKKEEEEDEREEEERQQFLEDWSEIKVGINEILPNPEGSDQAEWIEIVNQESRDINLKGWSIDDEEGGSRPYRIKENLILRGGAYHVFYRKETKIALNNNEDEVRLLAPNGTVISSIEYQKAKEGFSYALASDQEWYWTTVGTPGKANIIKEFQIDEENEDTIKDEEEKTGKKQASKTKEGKKKKTQSIQLSQEIPLGEVRSLELETSVKAKGVVSVEPGVLGKQIFYIAGSGIQIFSSKKDFPPLRLGDIVSVEGTLSENQGERRIKVASKKNIEILEAGDPPLPQETTAAELTERYEGSLVTVTGEVSEKEKSKFYLDDGSGEILVYLKDSAAIKLPFFDSGATLKVTGILSQTKSGFRLLPRYPEDIAVVSGEEVLETALPATSSEGRKTFWYLLATFSFMGITLSGLLLRYKKELFPWLSKIFFSGIKINRDDD